VDLWGLSFGGCVLRGCFSINKLAEAAATLTSQPSTVHYATTNPPQFNPTQSKLINPPQFK